MILLQFCHKDTTLEQNKIICASWIGRFGNRCHSYLYGKHIEQKFNQKFYVARPWEGCVLFKNPAPVIKNEFAQLRFEYAGGAEKLPSFKKNQNLIDEYNSKNNDSPREFDFDGLKIPNFLMEHHQSQNHKTQKKLNKVPKLMPSKEKKTAIVLPILP